MEQRKGYILMNIRTLLNLEQDPYQLVQSSVLDKFINASDQQFILIAILPSKEVRFIKSGSDMPKQGHIIHISKMKAKSDFFNFSLKPIDQFKYLESFTKNIGEPILKRQNEASYFQMKELKAVVQSAVKVRCINETDTNFNTLEQEFDFWQDLDIDNPSQKCSFFLRQYALIGKPWKDLESVDLNRMKNIIDMTWAVVNKIWNSSYEYNQKRFARLIQVFETEVITKIKLSFPKEGDLLEKGFDIKQRLIQSIESCKKFISLYKNYSKVSKKRYPNCEPKKLEQFKDKIIATYRTKAKIQIMQKLHDDGLISQNPKSLLILIKADNFLSSSMSLFKKNPKAMQKLESQKEKFSKVTEMCEPIITEEFQKGLKSNNFQNLLRFVQKWYYFFTAPQISQKTVELQNQAVKQAIEYCQNQVRKETSSLKGKQSQADQIAILINIRKKLENAQTLIAELGINSQLLPTFTKKNQKSLDDLQKQQTDILKQFCAKHQSSLGSKHQRGKILGKHIKILNINEKGFEFEISNEYLNFIMQTKRLIQFNLESQLTRKLIDAFEQAKKMNSENTYLKSLQSRYNNAFDKLQGFQKIMLKKELSDIQQSIQKPRIKNKISDSQYQWKDQEEASRFVQDFNKRLDRLTEYVKLFNDSQTQIEEIAAQLFFIQFSPQNFFVLTQKLEQVSRIIETTSAQRQNSEWSGYWKEKLTNIIQITWKRAILNGISIPMTIFTTVNGASCAYDPQFKEIKQSYYQEIKSFIGWPVQSKNLNGNYIIAENGTLVTGVYKQVERTFEKLRERLEKFEGLQKGLSIDIDALQDKLGKHEISSEDLTDLLMKLKSNKQQIEMIPNEENIKSFTVDNTSLKSSLSDKVDQQIDSTLQLIKFSIKIQTEQVEEYMNNAIAKLQKKPTNMTEMAEAMKEYETIRESQIKIEQKIKQIQSRNTNVRMITGVSFNTSNMTKRWENFQVASVEMNRLLGQQKNKLQQDVARKSESIQSEVQKLYKRYQQIKPKTENLDRQQILEIYEKIKEWQEQWNQVRSRHDQIEKDIKHFKMKSPDFSTYNRIKMTLSKELGNWTLFTDYRMQLEKLEKQEWFVIKGANLSKYSDLIAAYIEKVKNVQSEDAVSKFFKQMLKQNKQCLVVLKMMNGQNWTKDHWGMLFSILKIKDVASPDKLLFVHLLQSDLLAKSREIQELESRARGEQSIRQALEQLQAWSLTRQFELTDHNSLGRVTPLIKEWKDLMSEVSDHISMVSSIKDNKYAGRFKSQIEKYEEKFGKIDDSLAKMNKIQRQWIYLEPIFVRGALPSEQGRWKRLDEQYRNIMNNMANNPLAIELANIPGFIETLDTIINQLERCQKALNDYLEEKRNKFPRFYFLGDDDMLEILGQSQNPSIIQQHLKKLFSGIHNVKFSERSQKILAMRSNLGQEVKMENQIQVSDVVQNWLEELSKNMVVTLKQQLIRAKKAISTNKFQVLPSQVICLLNQLQFNQECSESIKNGSLKNMKTKITQQLSSLTKKCHQTKNQLILAKIKSLILDIIHQMSIVDLLLSKKVSNPNDWNWYKQLTFVQQGNDSVKIRMANTNFEYTFEYQGNAQKLVYTPLTDKCYLTLTQAMNMGLGGNPYGPAGTGKTESVKALALAFGRQVLVFNCDQGLDFHSMGRIFMGLVKCGAWGCFDQFNRLLEEQLSAISQQIQIIQQAIKAKQRVINLLGKQLDVNFNSGIFVTLNPAGKGYGGRSKLPDNLKQLFRPVAMSVPDNQLIAEVLLFAEGFKYAKVMAQKIIAIFTLSRQLLSRQLHYDWGLRALKTILTVAGRLIFEEKAQIDESVESQILIKALRINTISKLTFNDLLKFNILVKDVFPGIQIKDIVYQSIEQAVKSVFAQENFEVLDSQLSKILQFYEATKQRMGVVLVGPSGCGKTTIWKSLKKGYDKLKKNVKIHLMNPKSMPRSSFLGYMNNDTRQFSEGVLTRSARQVVKEDQDVLNWIICDGDVDPEWIEALNSVLDDNHLLTLPTGQRISFGTNVNFIFQTNNLQFASPATVSRMGMIFMNEEDINITSIISKWAKVNQNTIIKDKLSFLETICNKVNDQLQNKLIVSTTKVGLVRNAISLITNPENQQEFRLDLIKGLASNFDIQQRKRIFEIVFQKEVPGGRDPLSLRIKNGKIGDYKDETTQAVQTIYMTKDLQKDMKIVSEWISKGENVIIVGKQGCGKSKLLQASINEVQKHQKCKVVTIHCNRETKSAQLSKKLFQICQKVTSANGKILKPNGCSRQIIVLKQINLPKPDKYKTIELITFIQSLITHEGFYDHNLQFVGIAPGIQFVCIMKPSSTIGRFQLTTRFVSNLRVLKVDYNSVGTLQVLKTITSHHEKIQSQLQKFWQIVTENFKADDNAHYLFSPRNLNSIVESLSHYEIDVNDAREINSAVFYEVSKQFADRLVSYQQKHRFYELMKPIFGSKTTTYYYLQNKKLRPIQKDLYVKLLKSYIKLYEDQVKTVNIVLVDEVIDLMSSIERKLVEKGSLLLAGESGSLRKTILRIMTHKHKVQLNTVSNLRNPTLKQFYKDIRGTLQIAGGQNKTTVLFLEEHQLGKNQFYQKINSLISSGEISGLFNVDEIEGIVQDSQQLKSAYYGKSLYESFIERIKANLIVVLSLDHRNKSFYEVCSANPAFYSSCRLIWLNCFNDQSLKQICEVYLKEYQLAEFQKIVTSMIKIHQGSSKTFMQYLSNFVETLKVAKSKSGNKLEKLTMGLKKLQETSNTVNQLTNDAKKKKKLLTIKQKQADQSLNQITDAMQQASQSKSQAQKLQQFLEVEQKKITKDRVQVMHQLDRVQPLIQQAKLAVNGLQKKNIQNIRAFLNPPEAVRFVLKAALTLFGNKNQSWNQMKNFLKTCKQKILNFDIKQVMPKMRIDVQEILANHAYYFERENVIKASQDSVPLRDWVVAVVQYSKTYEKVRPLQENLNRIQKELTYSKSKLKECAEKVEYLEKHVSQLNDNFVRKTNQAETLRQDLKKAQQAMASGQELLEKLSGEKVRWQSDSEKLKMDVELMPRYAVLTASFITYLSESPENVRVKSVQKWRKRLDCKYFNFLNFVTTEANTLLQVTKGLPNDQLSIENSQILLISKQVPLIIDPHTQASSWLRQKLQNQGTVETLIQQDPKFINTLQLAVRFGKILIIQEIDYVEPILTAILKKDYVQQGPRNFIQIGQKLVDVNEDFKLFMTTRNNSIEIPYHQKDLISVINFSVTKSGLEGKLLSIIITHFQPEIEREKQKLLEEQEKLKINLSNLEEKLLKQLADSSGNILENKALINSLNETKQQSQSVTKSLKDSENLQQSLDEKRRVYLPVAEIGARLYISFSLLKKLSPMYKYNLSQFLGFFEEALQAGKGGSSQIQTIKHELIRIVYDNISVGLLKVHKLLLGVIIIKEVFEKISDQQFDVLVGNMISDQQHTLPAWLDQKQKDNFNNFMKIVKPQVNFNDPKWKQWFGQRQCEKNAPSNELSKFQQCLLINAIRPDRLMNSLHNFVTHTLQLQNLDGIQINVRSIAQAKMSHKTPSLFIVSVGFDPSKQIQEYANKTVGRQRFKQMSMGGDQNQQALELLREAAKNGTWLCLKNLHLVVGFVSTLEKQLLSMEANQNFRLFLTTESHEKFPPILLETCYKISYEAPPGLKKNFTRLLGSQNLDNKNSLQIILTYFHSLIQQRRNYIPQGWTKLYQFNYGDYKSGLTLITQISKSFEINWSMLYGLMLDTVYGGRIDNDVDMRLMDTYLHQFFNDAIEKGSKPMFKNITCKNQEDLVRGLPETDTPQIYGLPMGIGKAILRIQSKELIQNLKIVVISANEEMKFSREKWKKMLSPFFTLWKGLSQKLQSQASIKQITASKLKQVDPISSFVYSEISQAIQNYRSIKKQLHQLQNVIFGHQILTNQLEKIGQSLLKSEAPLKWRKIWQGPDLVSQWLKIFVKKFISMQKWVQNADRGNLLSQQLDLSDLYRPEIFFNALKQKAGRQMKIPVNELKINCSFSGASSEVCVKMKNIVLQGSSLLRNKLVDCKNESEYQEVPITYVYYSQQKQAHGNSLYPFYTDFSRTVILAMLPVQADGSTDSKIIASTAFMLKQS